MNTTKATGLQGGRCPDDARGADAVHFVDNSTHHGTADRGTAKHLLVRCMGCRWLPSRAFMLSLPWYPTGSALKRNQWHEAQIMVQVRRRTC